MLNVAEKPMEAAEQVDDAGAQVIRLETGEEVRLASAGQGQRVEIRSPAGELLFEYDPAAGLTRVHIPQGDLQFVVPHGKVDFAAAHGVRMATPGAIEMEGTQGVSLQAGSALRGDRASAEVAPGRMKLSAGLFELLAAQGLLRLEDLSYAGRTLSAGLEAARLRLDKLESVAGVVTSKAKRFLQDVEGLLQTRAGRARTVVERSYHVKSERVYMQADDAVKINGDKIHLG